MDIDANRQTAYVYNSSGSLGLAAQRQKLPIARYKDHILYLLEKHQVIVIVGETGCGKSTQIPQYLYEAGWCSEPGTMASFLTKSILIIDMGGSRLFTGLGTAWVGFDLDVPPSLPNWEEGQPIYP